MGTALLRLEEGRPCAGENWASPSLMYGRLHRVTNVLKDSQQITHPNYTSNVFMRIGIYLLMFTDRVYNTNLIYLIYMHKEDLALNN